MPRRPLFALSLLTLIACLMLQDLALSRAWLMVLIPCGVLTGALGLLTERNRLVRLSSALLIAAVTLLRLDWSPPLRTVDPVRGRLSGKVVQVRETAAGGWCTVAGELDLAPAPACACTVIVRVYNINMLPRRGSHVIVRGATAPPRRDPGWSNVEPAWGRSRAAAFLMTAQSVYETRPPPWWVQELDSLHNVIGDRLDARLPDDAASTMRGMLLGDKIAVDRSVREDARITGTAHLFAVSGLHVGVILGLILLVSGGSPHRWYRWLVAGATLLLFVAVTGGEPPAIRALVMAVLAGVARIRQRGSDGLNLLGASILLEITIWPTAVLQPSFLLSTVVTAGLLWCIPMVQAFLSTLSSYRWWRRAATVLSVHLAATIAATVPVAMLFESVSVLAPAVNVLVVPIMMLSLVSTVLGLLVSLLSDGVADVLFWTPSTLVRLANTVISSAADATPSIHAPAVPLVAVAYTTGLLWTIQGRRVRDVVVRVVLSTIIVVLTSLSIPEDGGGVACRRLGSRIEVRATVDTAVRRCIMGLRYGRPFVRSYHDRNRAP